MLDGTRGDSVVVAQVAVDPEAFKLGDSLTACESIRLELEQVVPIGGEGTPLLWISGTSPERAEDVVASDDDVGSIEVVDRDGSRLLVRVRWAHERSPFSTALFEEGATCTRCVGRDGTWSFTLRFPTHGTFSSFLKICSKRGIDLTLNSVTSRTSSAQTHGSDLTSSQYEILARALDEGYFSIPREITLADLAAELGISDTAASQRIRRGVETVLVKELRLRS